MSLTDKERLQNLLNKEDTEKNHGAWVAGKIPEHYKRLSIPLGRAVKLGRDGAALIGAYYGIKLFFTQSLITGAIFSGEFDNIYIITPSQYGKSYLMGRIGLLLGYKGYRTYIAGAVGNVSEIIMMEVRNAALSVADEVVRELTNTNRTELEKLNTSLSKQNIGFAGGGFVQPLTFGDARTDIVSNKAVGRSGIYIVDEAAEVSDESLQEIGRNEFSQLNGEKLPTIMISNPHKPGTFYDNMIKEDPDDRTLIIWMDALTAVQEERFTRDQVLNSKFAQRRSTLRRYLLCELDTEGEGMLSIPKVADADSLRSSADPYRMYFLGVDAAYKGKDNIEVCLGSIDEDGLIIVHEILTMKKTDWIDGVTSEDIISDIARIGNYYHVSMICVDVGFGVWLVEGLSKRGFNVRGINFGGGPTRDRIRARHYSATNALNMRAELHLDLQSVIDFDKIRFEVEALNKIKYVIPFITAERRANGKIKVRDKKEIRILTGKSPDELDSVLLMLHGIILMSGESLAYIT